MDEEEKAHKEYRDGFKDLRERVLDIESLEREHQDLGDTIKRFTVSNKALHEFAIKINQIQGLNRLLSFSGLFLSNNPSVIAGGIYLFDETKTELKLANSFGVHNDFLQRTPSFARDSYIGNSIFESIGAIELGSRSLLEIGLKHIQDSGKVLGLALKRQETEYGILLMILHWSDDNTNQFLETIGGMLGTALKLAIFEEG
ncbi:MAG: hypothetical protein GY771_06580 [bacterium]|nr:hypothetical protein [bacterium]